MTDPLAIRPAAVTVLRNVRVHTMSARVAEAAALAWRGDRLLAVGAVAEVLAAAGPAAEVIDGGGRLVIPGLIDSHIHFLGYADSLLRVDLDGAASLDEAMARIGERAVDTPAGEWVRGRGWNHHLWAAAAFPTREQLDHVTGRHPAVMARKDGHSIWVNGPALALAEITRDTPDPPGGRIGRDARGEPDGMLYEGSALDLVYRHVPDESPIERDGAVRQALHAVAAAGLTGFHDCEGPAAFATFQQLAAEGALPVRVLMLLALATLPESIAGGLRSGFGSDRLRVGPVKIFSDGSLGSQTAQMLQPFAGSPDNYGVPTIPQDELEAAVLAASAAGIAVAVHAIGDAANRRVLDAFARARDLEVGAGPRPTGRDVNGYHLYRLRHRIEHAQIVDPADWPRFRELGVIASMQPIHATSDMAAADRLWGARCGRGAYAWRSLKRAGVRVAFGSDAPVESFDPLLGIHAAVTRQDTAGRPPGGWYPQERLTVAEAVRAYTRDAAFAAGQEAHQGSLEPGMLADLVLLDEDLFTVDPAHIPQVRVAATIVGGEVVSGALS